MGAGQLDLDWRERTTTKAAEVSRPVVSVPFPSVPKAPAKVARPIERVELCDECAVKAVHFAATRCEFKGQWLALCKLCADARGVPWGAVPCCACKGKAKVLFGLIVDGVCTPVCRACKEAGGR